MNDDDYGVQLLRPLAEEPPGQPRVDVARAMRDGRRRRRRWWGGSALAAAVAVTATGGVVSAVSDHPRPERLAKPAPTVVPAPGMPSSCQATRLPTGGYKSVQLTAGDSSGRWAMGVVTDPRVGDTAGQKFLVWHDGELAAEVSPPAGRLNVTDINASGVAVGFDDGRTLPYVYRDGTFRRLTGGAAAAVAINDAGVIVGNLGRIGFGNPVRWPSPESAPEPLKTPPDALEADVRDVAGDGTVAGTILPRDGGSSFDEVGYLWAADGSGRRLVPPVPDGLRNPRFHPQAFRYGWLYGAVLVDGRRPLAYRYDPATDRWQKVADDYTRAQTGASSKEGVGASSAGRPAIFVNGDVLPLPVYNPLPKTTYDTYMIQSISDDARTTVGFAFNKRADVRMPMAPIRWSCR